ncbi:MAG TPA: hypothetical protein VGQ00_01105 [Candidatus Norongarragalinales archaeon]|jgi:hypothetical protein|nr:hypothetical protein [Candidatus Norongarragalinales archaeon]
MDDAQKEFEKLVEEAVHRKGAVLASLFFDAHGKDKENVQNALIEFVSQITREKGVLWCKGEIQDAIESGGLYSSYTEVKLLCDSFLTLHNLALRYGPISVDVLKPAHLTLESDQLHSLLMDAAQSTQTYAQYIREKVLTSAEREQFDEQMRRRTAFGKQLKEKKS